MTNGTETDTQLEPYCPPVIWVVESGERWTVAWRRFAPVINRPQFQLSQRVRVRNLCPQEVPEVDSVQERVVSHGLEDTPPVAVFWDLTSPQVWAAVQRRDLFPGRSRRVLHLAAVEGLPWADLCGLSEVGFRGTTVGAEGLPRLGRLLQRFCGLARH